MSKPDGLLTAPACNLGLVAGRGSTEGESPVLCLAAGGERIEPSEYGEPLGLESVGEFRGVVGGRTGVGACDTSGVGAPGNGDALDGDSEPDEGEALLMAVFDTWELLEEESMAITGLALGSGVGVSTCVAAFALSASISRKSWFASAHVILKETKSSFRLTNATLKKVSMIYNRYVQYIVIQPSTA
jgi:hypothetical protein